MAAVSGTDHLFISYATENTVFADWLARKLMSEGYKVWYDRLNLLGGESYPANIDIAIKEHSFRLLALLSAASLAKPNPTKERTLALNLSRERRLDFLIPLLIEPLSPTQLDWMTSDLTHIPFYGNWAAGFAALLEKLRSIGMPCDTGTTRQAICNWMATQDQPAERQEQLWTNLLPILRMPEALRGFRLSGQIDRDELATHWPHYNHGELAWAFEAPPPELCIQHGKPTEVHWPSFPKYQGMKVQDVIFHLVRRSLITHCVRRGAQPHPAHATQVYFPQGLLPGDRVQYLGYTGRRTYVKVTGERRFASAGQSIRNRYHLAVGFTPALERYGEPVVQLAVHLYLTEVDGRDLSPAAAFRRQRRIRKYWYNHQWLSRLLAVSSWLADGEDSVNVLHGGNERLIVGRLPLRVSVSQGIDEDALIPEDDDDEAVLDDDDPGEREEE